MRFDVEIRDGEARRALAELRRRGEDLAPAMRSVGELILNSARARFDSETAPDGSPWAPLAPRTVARKKRNAGKILTERGFLRGTLAVGRANADGVEVGSPLVYAATHQFGRGPIPARPFLGLSAEDERDVRDEIADFVEDAWK